MLKYWLCLGLLHFAHAAKDGEISDIKIARFHVTNLDDSEGMYGSIFNVTVDIIPKESLLDVMTN